MRVPQDVQPAKIHGAWGHKQASLEARHQRDCALVSARTPVSGRSPSQWTTFADATRQRGCTCPPLHHVVLRHDGQLIREPVGHNRKEAERALDARRGDLARRTYRMRAALATLTAPSRCGSGAPPLVHRYDHRHRTRLSPCIAEELAFL